MIPTARNIPPTQPSARQDALYPELEHSATARCASKGIVPATPLPFSGASRQAAQTDYPARPQPKNRPQAYPLGYVEDLFEVRTQLGVCFSSRR